MKRIEIKEFSSQDEQLKWLFENRNNISAQRKSISKESDEIAFISFAVDEKGEQVKAENPIPEDADKLKVKIVINTTGLLDSHSDVHIPGLWKKTLSESKMFYHIQEHRFDFRGIISDEVKAYTEDMTWKSLGADFGGKTEALIFESIILKDRNEYMFEQYRKGYVRNHSVGMRYIKDYFCINSDAYPDQKENWDKYIKYVANKEEAEAKNYFWAVTEAKIIEGSAVVRGSNWATPTESVTEVKEADKFTSNKNEPPINGTQNQVKKKVFLN